MLNSQESASKPMVAVLEEPESDLEDALRAMRVISPMKAGEDAEGKA